METEITQSELDKYAHPASMAPIDGLKESVKEYLEEDKVYTYTDTLTHSDSLGEIAAALAKAQCQMINPKKNTENPFFKSNYADLAAVIKACKPLGENEIAFIQPCKTDVSSGAVTVETMLIHSSGEWIKSELTFSSKGLNEQKKGMAITYFRRYQLAAMAGVAQEDDDGNAVSSPEKKLYKPQGSTRR